MISLYSVTVHPQFRQYMVGREGGDSLRLRVSSEEEMMLNDVLKVEGGSITELLVEGVWRVIAKRQSFRATRPKQLKDRALNFRLSGREAVELSGIAAERGCSFSDLVGEGIWHVLASRQQNEGYQRKARRILTLLNEIETIRASLY